MPKSQVFAFLVVAVTATMAAGDDQASPFKFTTKRDNDVVEFKVEQDKVVFSIHSPVGISETVIERSDVKWPGVVMLRLHLKGLESFRATDGKTTVHAAVSSHDGNVRIWKDAKEDATLDVKSPFWMEIRMAGGDGKPTKTIPLNDGYFEMTLPRAFFAENPRSITVQWIDFFR